MKDLQEIFSHVQEMKKEKREIQKEYRESLANDDEYQEILEQLKMLKERKKQIETRVQEQMGSRYAKLEELANEIKAEEEMLSDVAMTTLMDGRTVEVEDEYRNKYDPVFKVKFKKMK
jgi:predicted nuclease with TOPRIM domain